MSSRSRRKSFGLDWPTVGVLAVAVVAAVLAMFALAQVPSGADRAARDSDYVSRYDELVRAHQQAEPARVVFIGDSYTVGAGSQSGGFVQLLADREGWIVKNLGRGGTGYIVSKEQDPAAAQNACGRDYCEAYPEVIPEAATFRPDVVIVSGGRNNVSADPDVARSAVEDFYAKLAQAVPNAEVWATSPLWDASAPPAALADIAASVEAAVAAVGGKYLDLGQPLAGHPEWLVDGVHPDDRGYAAIAAAIEGALPRPARVTR